MKKILALLLAALMLLSLAACAARTAETAADTAAEPAAEETVVTTQVSEAAADCGIIYCTDAFSAGLTIVDAATKDMCGQVIYPAAVLNVSKNVEASAVFEAVGFTALS